MKPGQYYFDNLPKHIQDEFRDNCLVKFDYIMSEHYDSLIMMIDDAFSAPYTIQGRPYWLRVAETYEPTIKTVTRSFLQKNAVAIASGAVFLFFVTLIIAVIVIGDKEKTIKDQSNSLKEANRINAVNKANHITDSSNIVKQTYLPPGYDALLTKEEVYERMMDNTDTIPVR